MKKIWAKMEIHGTQVQVVSAGDSVWWKAQVVEGVEGFVDMCEPIELTVNNIQVMIREASAMTAEAVFEGIDEDDL